MYYYLFTPSPPVRTLYGKHLTLYGSKSYAFLEKISQLRTVQVLEKSLKKCFQLLCADKILKMVCGSFIKVNESRDVLTFGDFAVPKFFLHNKIINKIRTTKNQEDSARRFGDRYLTNQRVKFLQDRIKP